MGFEMINERRYLLERCLRLEARIAALEQERASGWATSRRRREVQAADREKMHALLRRGLSYNEIGKRLGWADTTVRAHTREVRLDREAAG
jgi:DNA-binding NarL/FixJ family response regulator